MKESVPLLVGLLAAIAAVLGYLLNARIARLRERERYFAEALLVTEQYKQLAFWRHRIGDEAEMARKVGEVHERLAYHRRWLRLNSPRVAEHYRNLVLDLRNMEYFRPALDQKDDLPCSKIELDVPYHSDSQDLREACLKAMDHELSIVKFWAAARPTHKVELFSKMSQAEREEQRQVYTNRGRGKSR